jgi:hypothetical protein
VLSPEPTNILAIRQRVKGLKALTESRSWAMLRETMEAEVVAAAMAIADNPRMTLDEINFRRGSIWAAKQLLSLPQTLLARAEGDLALASASSSMAASPLPAKAGQE